jgi:hypothetical protein
MPRIVTNPRFVFAKDGTYEVILAPGPSLRIKHQLTEIRPFKIRYRPGEEPIYREDGRIQIPWSKSTIFIGFTDGRSRSEFAWDHQAGWNAFLSFTHRGFGKGFRGTRSQLRWVLEQISFEPDTVLEDPSTSEDLRLDDPITLQMMGFLTARERQNPRRVDEVIAQLRQ